MYVCMGGGETEEFAEQGKKPVGRGRGVVGEDFSANEAGGAPLYALRSSRFSFTLIYIYFCESGVESRWPKACVTPSDYFEYVHTLSICLI